MSTLSPDSLGTQMQASSSFATSTLWPASNAAIFIPVEITFPITISKMVTSNGTIVAGNIDVGIYDVGGNRLVSFGSNPQSGTSAVQIFDITDTTLQPGLYYMAVALSSTGTLAGWNPSAFIDTLPFGVYAQASAFPLPATATFQQSTGTLVPFITMTTKTTI